MAYFAFTMIEICAILFLMVECTLGQERNNYIGCFKNNQNKDVISNIPNVQSCINVCYEKYFTFAALTNFNKTCFCTNLHGEPGSLDSSGSCRDSYIYSSKGAVPGPPKNFDIVSITDEGVEITWSKPENFNNVEAYEITAFIIHTFSQYPILNTTWVYPNNTFRTSLSLLYATRYNLTIRARSNNNLGDPAFKIMETPVGTPDNAPAAPEIISRNGSRMTVKINPVINNNGPISLYQVVVLDEANGPYYQSEYLKSYEESIEENLKYYITAELLPDDIKENFIIGDGRNYGKYMNAPLFSSVNYNVLVGIVSHFNNQTKVAYSEFSKTNSKVHDSDDGSVNRNNTSVLIIILIIAIVVLSILIIIGLVGFFILKRYMFVKHRHNRLSEQELTLQGPMISVENSAYLPEEEQISINHYKNLKQRLRIFSLKNELSVDAHSIIGMGKFGTVCKSVLNEDNENIPLAAYCIPDKTLTPEQKKSMLRNLDMLIRCGKHDNIVELIGTSESSHMLYVLLKVFPTNLKQFLINSRVLLPNKFSQTSESLILAIITQITHGLSELENNHINHTRLCARNIMLTEDFVPKIFGFGLADYVEEKELDYTRWSALEILKGHELNSRSPIWSFGILLWEICALGATPYSYISNISELIDKVSRGERLPQLKYFNDDVYQIMLNCWQVDMSERPNCHGLCQLVEDLHQDTIIPFISFQLYQSFEYEQYKPELEFKTH